MIPHGSGRLPDGVKALVGVPLRTFGTVTSPARLLPDVLVVGTQRGGTTSLFRTLRQHPDFVGPVLRKGVHYFDVEYAHGPRWYRSHFPLRRTAARRRRGRTGPPVVGEASPYYMSHPLAAERMARDLPGIRLVAMLRDPVERAYSAHAHELARGFETEPFARAVELEESRLAGELDRTLADPTYQSHALRHHAYLARGRYAEQLERLGEWVPRDRILVVDSHHFFTEPEAEYARLLEFLGLPEWPETRFERHNARPRSKLDEALRTELEAYFAPHDQRLADWLGRPPAWRVAESP